jgi:hypothetical protein
MALPELVSVVARSLVSAGHVAAGLPTSVAAGVVSQAQSASGEVSGEEGAPKALRQVLEHVPWAIAVMITLVVVVAVLRRVQARRALATRVVFAALPTESFDPSPEEIVRFAFLLLRCRRCSRGLSSRRTDSVRLKLSSLPGGRMIQSLEGPRRSESVLRMGGYAEVDLRLPETMDLGALSSISTAASHDEPEEPVEESRSRDRSEPEHDHEGVGDHDPAAA